MSVRELLATHTSYELSEWQAFDSVYGIGEEHIHDVLADVHEQLQFLNHMFGAANFTPENEPDDNPVPPPTRYPRGREARAKEDSDTTVEEEG